MAFLELMEEEKNQVASIVAEAAKPAVAGKKAKRTAQQIAANARKKVEDQLQARIQKAIAAEEKKQARRNLTKATRAKERNAGRQTVKNRVLSAARVTGLPFNNADFKIPSKGAKLEKVGDYLRAAKARYYKRTELPNSITRAAMVLAEKEGINVKHVKRTARSKDVNAILAAARKKMGKVTGKTQRVQRRNEIIEHVMGQFGIATPKEVQTAVCYREASERKK